MNSELRVNGRTNGARKAREPVNHLTSWHRVLPQRSWLNRSAGFRLTARQERRDLSVHIGKWSHCTLPKAINHSVSTCWAGWAGVSWQQKNHVLIFCRKLRLEVNQYRKKNNIEKTQHSVNVNKNLNSSINRLYKTLFFLGFPGKKKLRAARWCSG